MRNDLPFAERCITQAQQLQHNIEQHAWDGDWYRRAWFDNGEALGSIANQECQIDSLPQSWSVISGAGDAQRSRQAMNAVDQRLVHRDTGLIQLFNLPSTNLRSSLVTSKVTFRGYAKTAANIPTAEFGSPWPLR